MRAVPYWLEVVLAVALLVLLSPVLVVTAILVRLTLGSPVIFRQTRVGRDGVPFTLLKFRTMPDGAEAAGRLTIGSDERVVPLAAFLRAHRLDELPQLVNVVRGDMGLIGPRPEVPEYVETVPAHLSTAYRLRPGLTDPASLAFRDEASVLAGQPSPEDYYRRVLLPAKLQLSVRYAGERTLRSDLALLARTAGCLLPRRVRAGSR